MTNIRHFFTLSGIAALAVSFFVFAGCDSSSGTTDPAENLPSVSSDITADIADRLSLDAEQLANVKAVDSGDLWQTAAALQTILRDDQKDALKELGTTDAKEYRSTDGNRRGPVRANSRHAFGKLDLSDEQKEALAEQREAFKASLKELREDGELSDADRERAKTLRDEQRDAFLSILTPEQKSALDEIRQDGPDRRQGQNGRNDNVRRQGKMKVDRLSKLSEALALTDEQLTEINAIREESREAMKSAREEAGDNGASRDAMRAFREQVNEKIRSVLTEEQNELYSLHKGLLVVARSSHAQRDK